MPARLRTIAAQHHIVTVRTPSAIRKVFAVFFLSDGSLCVDLCYQNPQDGFLTESIIRETPQGEVEADHLSNGVRTSHHVKFSYHLSGRAQFSKTRQIESVVGKQVAPLLDHEGPVFLVDVRNLAAFPTAQPQELQKKSAKKGKTVILCDLPQEPAGVTFVGYWCRRSEVAARSQAPALGPSVEFDDGIGSGMLLAPGRGRRPRDRILLLTAQVSDSLEPDSQMSLLFLGAIEKTSDRSVAGSTLTAAYPRSAVGAATDALRSIDIRLKKDAE